MIAKPVFIWAFAKLFGGSVPHLVTLLYFIIVILGANDCRYWTVLACATALIGLCSEASELQISNNTSPLICQPTPFSCEVVLP